MKVSEKGKGNELCIKLEQVWIMFRIDVTTEASKQVSELLQSNQSNQFIDSIDKKADESINHLQNTYCIWSW